MTYHGNGNGRGIREYEFNLLKLGSPSPILCQRDPTSSAIAEAVGHNYGCGVLFDRGDNEGRRRGGRHFERGLLFAGRDCWLVKLPRSLPVYCTFAAENNWQLSRVRSGGKYSSDDSFVVPRYSNSPLS
jgi:hypothetical protein